MNAATSSRAEALLQLGRQRNYAAIDRLFAVLMLAQWAFAILLALVWSPFGWEGKVRSIHLHVQTAVLLGGLISSLPIALAIYRPGWVVTRHVIACAQMLWSALLIHLSGGRIETHFHVFGSLAFVAFYRDWRVLVPATVVVAGDHLVRGLLWPESVYGITNPEWWRFLEHAGWVVFEDIVLVMACLRGERELRDLTATQAELEVASESELRKKSDALTLALAELQSSQQTLVRAEKLAAVGELAASVAHELRNPLAAVRNAAAFVSKRLDSEADPAAALADPRVKQFFRIIDRETIVCTKIIGDLLDFARERPLSLGPCPLRQLVAEALELVSRPANAKVDLANEVPDTLPAPIVDRDQLRQVLVNLLQNAVEAMPAGRAGRVTVKAETDDGRRVRVLVVDNGVGIPVELQPRIFQPLFTTKNKGTGLGLAIVENIVKRHQGTIEIESAAGAGTTVIIDVPVEPTSYTAAAAATTSAPVDAGDWTV